MMLDDTIAAIATPLGEGGLAVIRLSGPQALAVADKSFAPLGKSSLKPSQAPTHTIHYGHIVRQGRTVDEVLLSVMRQPRTFTREDIVEITCHGGILAAKIVLDTVLENGARLAEPGEFTKRAFLNGRIDLTQAEAVSDLIHARTELSLAAANEQLAGKLSQRINQLRDDMMKALAHVEAHIDFPDEDIAPDTRQQLLSRLERGVAFMDELLRTANEGQILRRGVRAAIIGRPNTGKSSLLNQLLGHDRAIVSPIAGTTRDTIEETANIRGLPVVFVDTAGLRQAGDVIEQEGIRRSHETVTKAELILHVFDVSEPFTREDEAYLAQFAHKKRLIVRNKVDLPMKLALPLTLSLSPSDGERVAEGRVRGDPDEINATRVVDVCALTGQGIEPLKDAIKDLVWSGEIKAEMLQVMINSRHQDALRRAREATLRTIEAFRTDLTLELVALDLRIAVNAVGEIVGKTTTEDLLDSIFSQFCIGK
ncbi:MAG: tRNA uridine-5-carboxymethylaminomethyl(34) synthesis GTPase MnmE [Verrucomicrobia bacterium]|nr:MAG: tRNA uridine-5-carboxymethylaminomethyl(34) synthesis GTPase MnmE [Verrucomicrobiota bacterium]